MPTYVFECDEDSGCGNVWEIKCSMSELDEKKPKSCPSCKKRKHIIRVYDPNVTVNVDKTLGSLADKNARKMSADEKANLSRKHTEYKRKKTSWVGTKDGPVRRVQNG